MLLKVWRYFIRPVGRSRDNFRIQTRQITARCATCFIHSPCFRCALNIKQMFPICRATDHKITDRTISSSIKNFLRVKLQAPEVSKRQRSVAVLSKYANTVPCPSEPYGMLIYITDTAQWLCCSHWWCFVSLDNIVTHSSSSITCYVGWIWFCLHSSAWESRCSIWDQH